MSALRIDSHQHFWTLARGDYGWLTPELGPIHRDFGPTDLAPLLERHGIARTILVQAAPTVAETLFLLETARRTPFVAGVVGWCDFEAPDVATTIRSLASDRLLVGLRPMVHDIADPGWVARPSLAPAFEALIANRLVFDALLKPVHMAPLETVLLRHPDLTVVIDHAAKPDLVRGELGGWERGIAALAAYPNTVCKLSGLVTEAGPDWTFETLRPVVNHLIATFGPERLLWGSDWPVVTLRSDYARWFEAAASLLSDLDEAEREAVFGGNARRIYLTHRGRD